MERDQADLHTKQQPPTKALDTGSTRPLWKKVVSTTLWPVKASWNLAKWFFIGGPPRFVFGVAVIVAIYASYRLPADFLDRDWPYFGAVRRPLFWLLKGTGVQSILGALSLLAGYALIYWVFSVRRHRFIVVAEFRVWGTMVSEFPNMGVAARLRDELMRLWEGIISPELAEPWTQTTTADTESEPTRPPGVGHFIALTELPRLPDDGGLSLPETHVTLQYEGISLEAMHTFVRRTSGREVVITGDLFRNSTGLVLAARAGPIGPWEVVIEEPSSDTLQLGLKRLAVRIMTSMTKTFQPNSARTFALLQMKAREVEDYDEAFRLAKLGRAVATDIDTANWNLATAYNDIGVELAVKGDIREAIPKFRKATELNKKFAEARENLAGAYEEIGDAEKAKAVRQGQSYPE